MKLIPDWKQKVVSVATTRLGWLAAIAGTVWTQLDPQTQSELLGRLGLDGPGRALAATGLAVVIARIVAFEEPKT